MVRLISYLLEMILLLVVGRALTRAFQQLFGPVNVGGATERPQPQRPESSVPVRGETARDPVCGMFVSTELSQKLVLQGETLHFCSQECRERFRQARAKV